MSQTMQTPPPQAASDNADPRHRAEGATAVNSAKTPVNSSTLTILGLFWAVALLALGAVGVHDALVAAGAVSAPAWIGVVVDQVAGLRPDERLLGAATLVGLLGIVLVALALRPRRKRGVTVGAEAGTFLRHRHLSRLVQSRVETLDGAVSAQASARGRTMRVRVRGVGGVDAADLRARAESMIDQELAVLDKRIRTSVRIEGGNQ